MQKLLIIGISVIFILQSACNILMNVNFGITADLNIPFVSYSGGSLIVNMICMAVILGVYRRKNISYVKNISTSLSLFIIISLLTYPSKSIEAFFITSPASL